MQRNKKGNLTMANCKHCKDSIPHSFSSDIIEIKRHKGISFLFHLECFKFVAGHEFVPWVIEIDNSAPMVPDGIADARIDIMSEALWLCPNCDHVLHGGYPDCPHCCIDKSF